MKNENLVTAILGTIIKVVVVIALVFVVYKGAVKCYDYGYRIFTEPAMTQGEGREVEITLKPDMSAKEVGKLMVDKGLSRDATLFALQYMLSEYKEEVRPGTYKVNTSMTAEQIMAAMVPPVTETEE